MHPTYSCVLAVDDDPILLQVLTAYFAKHGAAKVLTAQDGAEAIDLLNNCESIDLIVTDLHMPGTNGIEFIEHLKDTACRVPLVIVSSAGKTTVEGVSVLASAYQLNFVGALPKPIKFDELGRLLRLPALP